MLGVESDAIVFIGLESNGIIRGGGIWYAIIRCRMIGTELYRSLDPEDGLLPPGSGECRDIRHGGCCCSSAASYLEYLTL